MNIFKFIYFAYGSNLLTKRIHINNPSASRIAIGKLENYRLDFNYQSQRWHGAAATIVPDQGAHVWGALWEINKEDMESLDRQEGVELGIYQVVNVTVQKPDGNQVTCRSYQLVDLPPSLELGKSLPSPRQPSKVYLDTIIEGAIESGLPREYVDKLRSIPHNGYNGPVEHKKD